MNKHNTGEVTSPLPEEYNGADSETISYGHEEVDTACPEAQHSSCPIEPEASDETDEIKEPYWRGSAGDPERPVEDLVAQIKEDKLKELVRAILEEE